MTIKKMDIFSELKKQIADYQEQSQVDQVGRIMEVKDGVAKVLGLAKSRMGEFVLIGQHNISGMILSLERNIAMVVIMGEWSLVTEGDQVSGTGQLMSVGVGPKLLGRVIDALGHPIDGKGKISIEKYIPIERNAPGVIDRQAVNTSLATGILSIDALVPIGRGQRELIIGDRFTGKTALAIDSIINQKGKGVYCIYVAIGQKQSKVAHLVAQLEQAGAMEYTVIVSASASDPATAQMIAPFVGCSIGEYFRDRGEDALVIYDDLTKHAWAYRQISLSLRRPPGREAYPGDIFYLHSRLLERAARLNEELGGGSLTALPIIETQGGDVSAYIPTNVISITDGQIYLDQDAFNAGNRPAIDAGLSVSRVGGAAQVKAMKQVAGQLRLDLAQYRDMAGFAQFGSDLDNETKKKISRGKVMVELLKQDQYAVMSLANQVLTLYAGNGGYLDNYNTEQIKAKVFGWVSYLNDSRQDLVIALQHDKHITPELDSSLKDAAHKFFKETEDA